MICEYVWNKIDVIGFITFTIIALTIMKIKLNISASLQFIIAMENLF